MKKTLSLFVALVLIVSSLSACRNSKTESAPPQDALIPIVDAVLLGTETDAATAVLGASAEYTRGKLKEAMSASYQKDNGYTEDQAETMSNKFFAAVNSLISYTLSEPTFPKEKTAYIDIYVKTIDITAFDENTKQYSIINADLLEDYESWAFAEQKRFAYNAFLYACTNATTAESTIRVRAKLTNSNNKWRIDGATDLVGRLLAAYTGSRGTK